MLFLFKSLICLNMIKVVFGEGSLGKKMIFHVFLWMIIFHVFCRTRNRSLSLTKGNHQKNWENLGLSPKKVTPPPHRHI